MDNQITQKPQATYEDIMAETILLAQRLPVGSYWKDDAYIYKIINIVLSEIAFAKCIKISLSDGSTDVVNSFSNSTCNYNYIIQEDSLFVSNIHSLDQSTEIEYNTIMKNIGSMYDIKNNELFQKQCLLNTPTDIPFTEFDLLHDEIIELQGIQYFLYEPAANCFRIFAIDMNEYDGKNTLISDLHFYMNSSDTSTQMLSVNRHDISLLNIVSVNKIFPITKFQFDGLKEFIDNNPNKPML